MRSIDGSGVLDVDEKGEIGDGGAIGVRDFDCGESGGGIGREIRERK